MSKKPSNYARPTLVFVLLLITVPPAFFYGGTVIGTTFIPKPILTHKLGAVLHAQTGPRKCKVNNLTLNPAITPPLNFPGYKQSSLIAFSGEITHITKDMWTLTNDHSSKKFVISRNVLLDKEDLSNYSVGDCITIYYGLKRGFQEKIYSVTVQ